jgi:hypothetical protein
MTLTRGRHGVGEESLWLWRRALSVLKLREHRWSSALAIAIGSLWSLVALAASLVLTLLVGPVLDRLDLPFLESWGSSRFNSWR